MKPTIVVLAAGLGSRYGKLKQIEGFGPNGELILDYTLYDAIKAGFGQVIFVIRASMEEEFKRTVAAKFSRHLKVHYVFQETGNLPSGCSINPDRVKPWGTGHALWTASRIIETPFCMVNADDFYGFDALQKMKIMLENFEPGNVQAGMIGYRLDQTLSEFGSVSRGVCEVELAKLISIQEHTSIEKKGEMIVSAAEDSEIELESGAIVSMNLMGFTPGVHLIIEKEFKKFYDNQKNDLSAEFYAPDVLHALIEKGIEVKVEQTKSSWFGVTYPEDKDRVRKELTSLIESGVYPQHLWTS